MNARSDSLADYNSTGFASPNKLIISLTDYNSTGLISLPVVTPQDGLVHPHPTYYYELWFKDFLALFTFVFMSGVLYKRIHRIQPRVAFVMGYWIGVSLVYLLHRLFQLSLDFTQYFSDVVIDDVFIFLTTLGVLVYLRGRLNRLHPGFSFVFSYCLVITFTYLLQKFRPMLPTSLVVGSVVNMTVLDYFVVSSVTFVYILFIVLVFCCGNRKLAVLKVERPELQGIFSNYVLTTKTYAFTRHLTEEERYHFLTHSRLQVGVLTELIRTYYHGAPAHRNIFGIRNTLLSNRAFVRPNNRVFGPWTIKPGLALRTDRAAFYGSDDYLGVTDGNHYAYYEFNHISGYKKYPRGYPDLLNDEAALADCGIPNTVAYFVEPRQILTGNEFFEMPDQMPKGVLNALRRDLQMTRTALYELPYSLYLICKYNDWRAYFFELYIRPVATLAYALWSLRITDVEIFLITSIFQTIAANLDKAAGVFFYTDIMQPFALPLFFYQVFTDIFYEFRLDPLNFLRVLVFMLTSFWTTPLLCLTYVFIKTEELYKRDRLRARLFAWLEMIMYSVLIGWSPFLLFIRLVVVFIHDIAARLPLPQGVLFHWLWNTLAPFFFERRGPVEYQGLTNPHDLKVRSGKLYLGNKEVIHWRPLRAFAGWERLSSTHGLRDWWSIRAHKTASLKEYYLCCICLLQGDYSKLAKAISLCDQLKPVKQSNVGIHASITLGKLAHQFANFTSIMDFLVCFANEIAYFGLNLNHWYNFDDLSSIMAFFKPGNASFQGGVAFLESEAYKEISGFITSLLVTLGFGSERLIPINLMRRFTSALDLVKYVATLPQEIYQAISSWYLTGNVPSFFLGGMNRLTARANVLLAKTMPKGDNPHQKRLRLEMSTEAKDIIKELERCVPRDKPMPDVHLKLLNALKAYATPPENQVKPEPFVLVIYGAAGTGKSVIAKALHSLLAKEMDWSSVDNPPTNSMYAFRGGKHLDAVEHPLSKHTFIFDDFLQSVEQEDIATEMLMFHKFAGTTATPMPMASIEGKTQANDWRPNFLVLCTNFEDVFDIHRAGDLLSYTRRVDLYVEVTAKGIFSSSKIPGPADRSFNFFKLTVKNGEVHRYPVTVYGVKGTNQYPDFLRLVSSAIIAHSKHALVVYEQTMSEKTCEKGLPYTYHCQTKCVGGCDYVAGSETILEDPIQPFKSQRQGFNPGTDEKVLATVVLSVVFSYAAPSVVNNLLFGLLILILLLVILFVFLVSVLEKKFGLFTELYRVLIYYLYYLIGKKFKIMTVFVSRIDEERTKNGLIGALYMECLKARLEEKSKYFLATFGALIGAMIFSRFKKDRSTVQGNVFEVPDNSTLREENVRQDKTAQYIRNKLVISGAEDDIKDLVASACHTCMKKDVVYSIGLRTGNYIITTLHSASDGMVYEGIRKTGVFLNNNYQVRLTANIGKSSVLDPDLVAMPIPETPAKDLSTIVLSRADVSLFTEASGFVFCQEYPGAQYAWHDVKMTKLKKYDIDQTFYDGFEVRYPFNTFVGLCGAPILLKRVNARGGVNCVLVGIHHAGVTGDNIGYARLVYKEMFSQLSSCHLVEMESHRLAELQAIGEKGANNLQLAGVCVGNITTMNRVRTNLRESVLAPEFPHITAKFAVPEDVAYIKGVGVGPLYQHWNCKPQLGTIDLVAAHRALEDLIAWDSRWFGDFLKEQRPLSVSQAIKGIPGTYKSVNLHTSAGYGFPGPKSEYMSYDEDSFVLDDRIAKQMLEYEELATSDPDIVVPVVVTTFVKDEVRKKGKSYRWIGIFPTFFLLLCRMFLTILFYPWKKLPTKSECWVGVNATGKAWSEFCQNMEKGDDEFYWCIDFRFWDRTFSEVSRCFFNKYIIAMIDMTEWSFAEKLLVIAIIRTLGFVFVIIHTVVFAMTWYVQSGDPITVFINSWFQRFLIRYWYYKVTKSDKGDFRENVTPNTYGDDGTGHAKRLPGLDQFSLAEAVADFGCVATASDKGELKSEVQWEDLSFLKRGLVRDPKYGGYRGPLEEESIEKMLCWFDTSSSLNEEMWLPEVVDNAMREYFLHGEEKFAEKEIFFKDLCRRHDIRYKSLTFDQLMEKWNLGEFSTWTT